MASEKILTPPEDWSWVTDSMFDAKLSEVADESGWQHVEGVYELLREHYNNDVLSALENERDEPEEEDEEE